MREELKKPLLEIVRIIGIALAVYVILRFLLPLVIPFLIAFLLAKQIYPITEKLHKKLKIKKGILSIIILLIFLVIAGGILWFVGENLVEQIKKLFTGFPVYQEKIIIFWHNCCVQLEGFTGVDADELNQKVTQTLPEIWENMKKSVVPTIMNSSLSWMKGVGMLVGICIVTGVSTLLIIKEYSIMKEKLETNSLGKVFLNVLRRVYRAGGAYIKAQFIIMLVVSLVCVIGLFCTGNSYALLAGIGIGFCDALPFLGTGIVFIPWAIIELLNGHYMMAAVYAVIYTIASLTRELLEPKLVGDKLGIHPLAVIVSVYVGLCIYGLWGFALGPISYILIREIWQECYGKCM